MPIPEEYPNIWLIFYIYDYVKPNTQKKKNEALQRLTMLSGAIQHTQLNTLKAWNKYPGKKYQKNEPKNAYKKKRSREIPPRLPIPAYTCEWSVLKRAQLTRLAGQTGEVEKS